MVVAAGGEEDDADFFRGGVVANIEMNRSRKALDLEDLDVAAEIEPLTLAIPMMRPKMGERPLAR